MSPLTSKTFQVMFTEHGTYVVTIKAPDAESALGFAQSVYEARGSDVFALATRHANEWVATEIGEVVK